MDIEFPVEFLVEGAPVSFQAKRAASRLEWRERVRSASLRALPDGHFATNGRIAVTLYYFPAAEMGGDIDNIVKPILDALSRHVYMDDRQVERVVVQKFEPGEVFDFAEPSAALAVALTRQRPILHVRLTDDPFEELK